MFVCDSKDNKSYLRDTNKTIFASRWRVLFKNPHNSAAWKYRTWVLRLPYVLFSLITSFNREEVMFVCDSKDNKTYLRETNETIFASRLRVFIKKTQITEQHGTTEREFCVYLTFWFSIFTTFNRQEVMFVCDSKHNKSNLRDTKETIFGSGWRVFMKKTQITEQHGITERGYCVYLTFSHSLFTSMTERKWCLFAIQKITKAIFATPTKQFLLADEAFSWKTHITQQHGITEREYCVYLTFSFSLFTSFNRHEVMFVCDSKDEKAIFATPTKQFLLADEEFSSKNPQLSSMEL